MRIRTLAFATNLAFVMITSACVIDHTKPFGDPGQDTDDGAGEAGGGPNDDDAAGSSGGQDTSADPTGAPDATSGGGGPVGDGLPCEIDEILATSCRACHGATPAGGAPNSMLTLDDLLVDALTAPGTTVAAASAHRFGGQGNPMPPMPASPLSPSQVDAWTAWVGDGMPAGDCGTDPGPDPFDVDPICTTDDYWTQGLFVESDHMNPGRECIGCHEDPGAFGGEDGEEGPPFAFAGTVFATAHEPEDCYGVDGTQQDVEIVVADQSGQSITLRVNEAGNFYAEPGDVPEGFEPPWSAMVVADGLERAMVGTIEDGDCNRCHTQDGNEDAPGRIILP